MAVALVQHKERNIGAGEYITLDASPTPGNYLVLWSTERDVDGDPGDPSGFTAVTSAVRTGADASKNRYGKMWYRVVQSGDGTTFSTQGWTSCTAHISEWSGVSAIFDTASASDLGATATNTVSITAPGDGRQVAMIGAFIIGGASQFSGGDGLPTMTPAAGTTELHDMRTNNNASPRAWLGYKLVSAASGSITVSATQDGGTTNVYGRVGLMLVAGGTTPVADFTSDLTSGVVPTTVCFTDLSSGTPTSWLWDFGDGSTSTSQNPCHTYTVAGGYTVTLTATNASGSDSEVKSLYINVSVDVGYEEPLPGMALVEIYAAEAGAARWDVATWDDNVWSTGAWQDVTPESVQANILWGSNRPELGILSKPDAGSWTIDMYDPERLLDPANSDGPWFTDLLPGLPVRITHRGIVIRQGIAEAITHEFDDDSGIIRVQDNIARLANADVPGDVALSDTLYTRAADAIAAAGLDVTVLPVPPSGDPAVAPWVTDVNAWTAWQWITDAAEQALHIAYIDRIGRLGFRAWASPLARGRTLSAEELIGLTSIVQYNGQFSQVSALDSVSATVETRALTPPPRYGVRTYERTASTLDAGDWAAAVLLDRAFNSLRWVPGTMYPLTANSVELLATIEAVEAIGLVHSYTSPEVLANLVIVGGGIRITAKKDDEAKWWFTFEAAQVSAEADLPLITEDGTAFVVDETSGIDYVYPE